MDNFKETWDNLKEVPLSERDCRNCVWNDTGSCMEPSYIQTRSYTCGKSIKYPKWQWNGKR